MSEDLKNMFEYLIRTNGQKLWKQTPRCTSVIRIHMHNQKVLGCKAPHRTEHTTGTPSAHRCTGNAPEDKGVTRGRKVTGGEVGARRETTPWPATTAFSLAPNLPSFVGKVQPQLDNGPRQKLLPRTVLPPDGLTLKRDNF